MNKAEHKNVAEAVQKALGQVRSDFERMGGVTKRLKKAMHKRRMQNFQNKAFNKESK